MSREIDETVAALARRQHGVVTRAQLLELGIPPGTVRSRVTAGRLRRLHRGVYLIGPIMPPRAREMAAVLACGPTALLSHGSAIVRWELADGDDRSAPLDVSVLWRHARSRPGIRVRRVSRMAADEQTVLDRISITTPGRTLLDFASIASRHELERAIARAERERLVDRDRLWELIARYRGRSGLRRIRNVLAEAGGPALTRSEAEARFLDVVRDGGLPAPEANVVVDGFELDFFWRHHGIAVEVDGYRFHSSRQQFERDRQRATDLAARGIHVIRITWRQIVNAPVAIAVKLGQALMRAERS